jgi:hypothetical protein
MLREVVAAVVPERECAQYLPFARELYAALRHEPRFSRHRLLAKTGDSPSERSTRGTVPVFAVPDFDRRTKLVVRKWFVRGLSGHYLWRIGERMLGRIYPPAGSQRGHN